MHAKKPFLLLEILLAFTLVTICLIPLVKQPLKFYREELIALEQMEWERMADWSFTEVKELLLKNEIPWGKIPKPHGYSGRFTLPSKYVEIPGYDAKEIKRSFQLCTYGEKEGLQNQLYRQVGVKIFLSRKGIKEKKYKFRLPIQRLLEE